MSALPTGTFNIAIITRERGGPEIAVPVARDGHGYRAEARLDGALVGPVPRVGGPARPPSALFVAEVGGQLGSREGFYRVLRGFGGDCAHRLLQRFAFR